jgi:hypothetical protein
MSLFKTTDEIKDFLPVNITFEFRDILPFLKEVEREIIVPVLGKDQYNDLHTKYQADTITAGDSDDKLLQMARIPLASFAYMKWIPWGQVQIDSGGIRIVSSENLKSAFPWQIQNLEQSARASGFSGIEALYVFLEENKATYTLWASSSAYTQSKELFINSAKEFTEYVNINCSRWTFNTVRAIISRIEDTVIKNTLGTTLFDAIKAEILSGSISSANQDLLNLIRPALANLTMAKAMAILPVKIDEFGITVLSTNNPDKSKSPAPADQISFMIHHYKTEGEDFLTQLQDKVNEGNTDYDDTLTNPSDAPVGIF